MTTRQQQHHDHDTAIASLLVDPTVVGSSSLARAHVAHTITPRTPTARIHVAPTSVTDTATPCPLAASELDRRPGSTINILQQIRDSAGRRQRPRNAQPSPSPGRQPRTPTRALFSAGSTAHIGDINRQTERTQPGVEGESQRARGTPTPNIAADLALMRVQSTPVVSVPPTTSSTTKKRKRGEETRSTRIGSLTLESGGESHVVDVDITVAQSPTGYPTMRHPDHGPFRFVLQYRWQPHHTLAVMRSAPRLLNALTRTRPPFDLIPQFQGMSPAQRREAIGNWWIAMHGTYE